MGKRRSVTRLYHVGIASVWILSRQFVRAAFDGVRVRPADGRSAKSLQKFWPVFLQETDGDRLMGFP